MESAQRRLDFPEWLTITAVNTDDGVSHFVSTLTDITQRKEDEEKIRHLAYYDPLTLLPNRRLLMDRLQHALAANRRRAALGRSSASILIWALCICSNQVAVFLRPLYFG